MNVFARCSKDTELQKHFTKPAKELTANEAKILGELTAAQGKPQDMGGYYHPNFEKASKAMRPSATLNAIIDNILSVTVMNKICLKDSKTQRNKPD